MGLEFMTSSSTLNLYNLSILCNGVSNVQVNLIAKYNLTKGCAHDIRPNLKHNTNLEWQAIRVNWHIKLFEYDKNL